MGGLRLRVSEIIIFWRFLINYMLEEENIRVKLRHKRSLKRRKYDLHYNPGWRRSLKAYFWWISISETPPIYFDFKCLIEKGFLRRKNQLHSNAYTAHDSDRWFKGIQINIKTTTRQKKIFFIRFNYGVCLTHMRNWIIHQN